MMAAETIPPGGVIGILGGGQLGRMLAMAAARLGYRCHIYAPEADPVAGEVAARTVTAGWDDAAALADFAARCDVITYEFENVPLAALDHLGAVPLRPGRRALEISRDRLHEKRFIAGLGGRTAEHAALDTPANLASAVAALGTPGIVKTRADGYDGKGQWRIATPDAAPELPAVPMIYERLVDFSGEFSVILCRAADDAVVVWDSAENAHQSGILMHSTVPASPAIAAQVGEARALARRIADALDHVGVLTVEFFATVHGPVCNEIAPRVHNSGHWSIEGALTSQFENHIRAICGLPLGDPALAVNGATMRNLIGDAGREWAAILSDPANHLHLYGKPDARPGRKMGHVTRLVLG